MAHRPFDVYIRRVTFFARAGDRVVAVSVSCSGLAFARYCTIMN